MAAHNYDGDMLTDEVAQVHRSPGFINSVLIGKKASGDVDPGGVSNESGLRRLSLLIAGERRDHQGVRGVARHRRGHGRGAFAGRGDLAQPARHGGGDLDAAHTHAHTHTHTQASTGRALHCQCRAGHSLFLDAEMRG